MRAYSLPHSWRWARLAEIAEITMGNSPPGDSYNDQGDGVPLINGPVEFSDGDLGATIRSKYTTAPTKLCRMGDVLICVRGSTTGRTNVAAFDACIGRGVAAIRAHEHQGYLNHYLRTLRQKIYDSGKGSTFPSISQDQLSDLDVPLPPLSEQKRIAAILDKADALRRKRQQSLQLTDQFLRSTFLDMFGNPVRNPRDWETLRLDDVSIRITDGEHLNPEFTPEGVPMVMAANVLSRGVSFDGVKFISERDHERFSKKCNPEWDDLLIVSRGATIGRCTLVDVGRRFSLMGSVILVKPERARIVPAYLECLLSHPGYRQRLFNTSSASAQQAIYISHLKEMWIPVPPVEFQLKFDAVFRRTESNAERHEAFYAAMDQLFHSLVQCAFRGDL